MTGGVRGLELDPRDLFVIISTGCAAENAVDEQGVEFEHVGVRIGRPDHFPGRLLRNGWSLAPER